MKNVVMSGYPYTETSSSKIILNEKPLKIYQVPVCSEDS